MAGLAVVGMIATVTAATVWRGYVLSILWLWFVASQFGAPVISTAQAVGIALVTGLLTQRHSRTKDVPFGELAGHAFGGPLVLLVIAWIVRGFL